MRVTADPADREAAFETLHAALTALGRTIAPILPFLSETLYQNLVVAVAPDRPDSVHLTAWPTAELAADRDPGLEAAMATVRVAVDLARTLRAQAGIRVRQPLARAWLALPDRGIAIDEELLALFADEMNVRSVEVIQDGSDLVERRVKVLLPKVGKRLGAAIPAVMAAARAGRTEFHEDGSVTIEGHRLAADEVEVQATPRPGTAVADRDGLVVVLDTALTPELRAEGDARELARAIQDLRREAGLELDDRIEVWLDGVSPGVRPHLAGVLADTLATAGSGSPPDPAARATVELESGPVQVVLRRVA
jgi:isoleucyl-tRNA synthetase